MRHNHLTFSTRRHFRTFNTLKLLRRSLRIIRRPLKLLLQLPITPRRNTLITSLHNSGTTNSTRTRTIIRANTMLHNTRLSILITITSNITIRRTTVTIPNSKGPTLRRLNRTKQNRMSVTRRRSLQSLHRTHNNRCIIILTSFRHFTLLTRLNVILLSVRQGQLIIQRNRQPQDSIKLVLRPSRFIKRASHSRQTTQTLQTILRQ